MSAGHRVNHMTVRMWPQDFLHPVACAKSQITLTVEPPEPAAQRGPSPRVPEMPFHDRTQSRKRPANGRLHFRAER